MVDLFILLMADGTENTDDKRMLNPGFILTSAIESKFTNPG